MTSEQHISKYLESFSKFESGLNGGTRQPYFKIRKEAMKHFANTGFPTTKDEDWRFTNLSSLVQTDFHLTEKSLVDRIGRKELDRIMLPDFNGIVLVFVNGLFSEQLSQTDSGREPIHVSSLSEALRTDEPVVLGNINKAAVYTRDTFTALNTAFMQDGAYIHIPDNCRRSRPVALVFLSVKHETPIASYPRNLIVVGKNSQANLIEYYVSLEQDIYLTDTVNEIYISENSQITFDKIQNESFNGFHVSNTVVHQSANSKFKSIASTFGGKLVRNNIEIQLNGECCETAINGLYLGHGSQHIDNFTFIDHARAHCNSHELYRGILGDKAKGVFSGKILVRQDAQKTDAIQSNNCLLLSDDAKIDSKPQLEIYADDVRCTHGATVGQLDQDAMFYLRARGIERKRAQNILTYAFAEEVIGEITDVSARMQVGRLLRKRLEQDIHFTL